MPGATGRSICDSKHHPVYNASYHFSVYRKYDSVALFNSVCETRSKFLCISQRQIIRNVWEAQKSFLIENQAVRTEIRTDYFGQL